MKRYYFTGNIDTIIEYFKFKKVPQFEHEDKVYTLYELILEGFKGQKSKIEITIIHYPEKEDIVYFEFVSNTFGTGHHIRLDIQNALELGRFIKTIS